MTGDLTLDQAPAGLRLVRLRLALALLAMAAVPLAVGAIVLPALRGSESQADRDRVAGASAVLSTAVAAELERTRSAVLLLAANPSLAQVAGATRTSETGKAAEASKAAESSARSSLQAIARVVGDRVPVVSVLDRKGVERLRLAGGKIVPPSREAAAAPLRALIADTVAVPAGEIHRSEPFAGPGGDRRLMVAAPIVAKAGTPASGVVVFEISLSRLLSSAAEANRTLEGGYELILDTATGAVVADSRETGRAPTTTPEGQAEPPAAAPELPRLDAALVGLLSGAGQAWATLFGDGWSVGLSPLSSAVPGFDDWAVVVAAPATVSSPPVTLLAVLGLLALLLLWLTTWMTRQILKPSVELEASRAELRRLYESARIDSLLDVLTGLGNHRAFQEEFDRQIEHSRRHGQPVSLMLIDLDDFKQINDTGGHAVGDEVLARMGAVLAATLRKGDRPFRIGGDEFAIVMPATDADGAYILGRRLLARILQPAPGEFPRPISFSAGISAAPRLGTVRSELYAQADAALYWAKRHGRTNVEIFDAARQRIGQTAAGGELSAAIATVAEQRLLRPVFQPIIDLRDGRILGYEALVRPLPDSGFSDAGSLFAAAEATGRVAELDQACLETVAQGARLLQPDLLVSFNLSPRTIEAPEFSPGALRALMARHDLDPSRVVLEVTERESVDDVDRLRRNLQACQAAGFRIAADDVGAGNAGLRLLSQINFDVVKVDLSLVQGGAVREASMEVLRSLGELAGRWGALVIAEGVETPEQLRVVREMGAHAAQGYLLGRPGEPLTTTAVDIEMLAAGDDWLRRMPSTATAAASPTATTAAIPTAPNPTTAGVPVGPATMGQARPLPG